MPRRVRNFWLEIEVDGRKTVIATGPRARDGGFLARFFQRKEGSVVSALEVEGRVCQLAEEDLLVLHIVGEDGKPVVVKETVR